MLQMPYYMPSPRPRLHAGRKGERGMPRHDWTDTLGLHWPLLTCLSMLKSSLEIPGDASIRGLVIALLAV